MALVLAADFARACFVAPPSPGKRAQGRPGAGWHPRSAARNCKKANAQRHTGEARTSRPFPAQWLYGLCRDLPGKTSSVAPVALRPTTRTPGRAKRVTARRGASLGRQDHAILPYANRTCRKRDVARSRLPALRLLRANGLASTAARPACRDDRDTPLFHGPECAQPTSIPNFCKVEYFYRHLLTELWRVLPDGQHQGLMFEAPELRSGYGRSRFDPSSDDRVRQSLLLLFRADTCSSLNKSAPNGRI